MADDRGFDAILETGLYHRTDEAKEVERFYGEVLGLPRVAGWDYGMAFRVAQGVLLLFDREKLTEHEGPIAAHGASGPGHACLRAGEGDYEGWKARLEADGVAITHEQDWPNGLRSFYFSDPAGNLLEVAEGDLWPG